MSEIASAASDNDSSSQGPRQLPIPISKTRGTAYLRKQHVRTKAYAEIYYVSARIWNRWFYILQLVAVAINVVGAIAAVGVDDGKTAGYLAAAAGITAAAIGLSSTVINPGEKSSNGENAGDSYSDLADDLELFDPEITTREQLTKLVRKVGKRLKKLRSKFTEPNHQQLNKWKEKIRKRITDAKGLLYCDENDNNDIESNRRILNPSDTVLNLHEGDL